MQTQGSIKSISISFPSKRAVVAFEMAAAPEDVEKYQNKDLDITFEEHREKRSLSANSYFHVLCDKLRQAMQISMAECKNHLIAAYGQVLYLEGQQAVIKTNVPPEEMYQAEYLHTWLIKVGTDGAYWYRVYRGSSTYDTAEMSKLIDGTVTECKAQGIETMSKGQLKILLGMWDKKRQAIETEDMNRAKTVQQELKL